MTRSTILDVFVLLIGMSCPACAGEPSKDVSADSNPLVVESELAKLEGKWRLVSEEDNGRKASPERLREIYMVFNANRLFSHYGGESKIESTFQVDPTANPKTIDVEITKGDVDKKRQLAIYQLEKDTLTICVNVDAVQERPTTFEASSQPPKSLLVYKRSKN